MSTLPSRLYGLRVANGLSNLLTTPNKITSKSVTGFKTTTPEGKGRLGFQFEAGKSYRHDGAVQMCRSGFHFSGDPLHSLIYAPYIHKDLTDLTSPSRRRLFRVFGNLETVHGSDKSATRLITFKDEVKGSDKDELFTGIAVTDWIVACFRRGFLTDPAPGIPAFWIKSTPTSDVRQTFPGCLITATHVQNSRILKQFQSSFETSPCWPPQEFRE